MDYAVCADLTGDEADHLQRELIEFADQFTGPRNYREFGIALRDANGKAVGGITANTVWDWLQIGVLWIPESMRGKGYGSQLLHKVEELARERGCKYARLNTFDFEARQFYERHGYTVASKTDDFPAGHTQFHLTKVL